ncbi:cupin domain-containing protein [Nocardia vermiculata]|uniref:Cupin domain-containing protein n=1 Tax=Nocardia vermiculata TaxID=257274 RepID=A0A846Y142_9NOCA|nr:cupin domain-containing protein [Nocardia vermiculata]
MARTNSREPTVSDRPALARALDLQPHPEGGWFRETWRSPVQFEPEGYTGPRASATAIHYLLLPQDHSAPHTVASDEIWLWQRGGPLLLNIGGDEVTLGPDVERGQLLQAVVPAGVSQAARPAGDEYVLVSCVVSPGFDFADFRLD